METGAHVPSVEEQRLAVIHLPAAPKIKPGASEFEIKYFQELYALEVQNNRMGVEAATVVNLNPFPLKVEHPLFHGLTVPACPVDKPFTMLIIRKVRYQAKDNEGIITPVDFKPVLLALEFESQAVSYGGVFVLRGDAETIQEQTGDLLKQELFSRLHKAAKKQMLENAKAKKAEADNEWNTPARAGARNITEMHRNYTRILLAEKLISKAPDWMDVTRDEASIADDCPNCGSEPKKGAAMCSVCAWVLDPLKAWNIGAITDSRHASLARLSRSVLENLGITEEDVPETIEERNTRLKSGNSGKAEKPRKQQESAKA